MMSGLIKASRGKNEGDRCLHNGPKWGIISYGLDVKTTKSE